MPLAKVKRLYRFAAMTTEVQTLAGRLLLAMPGMGDPRFERATIALFVHDAQGAFGIDLGTLRTDIGFHGLLTELGIKPGRAPDCPVLHGGPVEPGRGFVLHSPDWTGAGTLAVPPLGALTATPEILEAIAAGQGPRHWLIALGYAGWGPGQLDGEMQCTAGMRPKAALRSCSRRRPNGAGWRAGGRQGSIPRCWPAKRGEHDGEFDRAGAAAGARSLFR